MPIISGGKVIEGARQRTVRPNAVFEYDFAIDGGAVSTIALRQITGGPIPSGAEVVDTILDILTIPTSGGAATGALQIEAANDVVAAAVISGAPWSSLGRKSGIPVSAATSLKTTAARNPSVLIGAFAWTAGKFRLVVEYIDPSV
jgi:hypothetical protein